MLRFKQLAAASLCLLLTTETIALPVSAAGSKSAAAGTTASADNTKASSQSEDSKDTSKAQAETGAAESSDEKKDADSKSSKTEKDTSEKDSSDDNASDENTSDENTSNEDSETVTVQRATTQDLNEAVMSTNPEDAAAPITEKPDYDETPYVAEFDYSSSVVFSGVFDTNQFYFQIEDYWDTEYAYARVQFTLSQLIGDGPASLTFSLNNEPIYSCKVDYNNGKEQIAYVPIPVSMLNKGYNSFGVTGYVKIYDNDGCIDDLSGANWVCLEDTSFVAVGYDVADSANLISWYPYPYLSSTDASGSQTTIAVSDEMDEGELTAALLLRADLASETDGTDELSLTTISDMESSDSQKVIISLLKNLPEEYQNLLPEDTGDLTDQALILSSGSDNTHTLLITSADSDCLMEAAMLLADETRVSQETGTTAYVSKDASQIMQEELSYSDSNSTYTLTSLSGGGLSYVGPFHQEETIYLPFSGGYVLSGTGKIDLTFRYSENLDFDRSLITVYWGETPVASKKLTKENAGGDTLTFSLPEDVLGNTAGSIKIAFDLELPDLFCSPRMDEMPWAYVAETSTFYLPVGKTGTLSFDNIPAPFELSSRFNDLTVVIPDEMTAAELDTLGQIIAVCGVDISSYGSINVVRAGQFDGDTTDRNLIVLGTYQDNALLRTLNDSLSFQYAEDGTKFESNSSQILSDDYASRIGVTQLLQSPYGEDRAILAVCTTGDAAMQQIRSYLSTDTNKSKLTGDAVIFDTNGEISTYQFLTASKTQNPDLKTFVENNKTTVLFTVVAVSAMLILLLGVLLILVRIHIVKRRDK